ncbi:hypothetical protein [Kitasatospora nipponensis]
MSDRGSADGHATVVLTEAKADGTGARDVRYQVRLGDLVIDGLTDTPAA